MGVFVLGVTSEAESAAGNVPGMERAIPKSKGRSSAACCTSWEPSSPRIRSLSRCETCCCRSLPTPRTLSETGREKPAAVPAPPPVEPAAAKKAGKEKDREAEKSKQKSTATSKKPAAPAKKASPPACAAEPAKKKALAAKSKASAKPLAIASLDRGQVPADHEGQIMRFGGMKPAWSMRARFAADLAGNWSCRPACFRCGCRPDLPLSLKWLARRGATAGSDVAHRETRTRRSCGALGTQAPAQ